MNITPLTMQQVLDNALNVMRARDYRVAADSDGRCLYRSSVGSCVIGASIPDELYDESIENTSASALYRGHSHAPFSDASKDKRAAVRAALAKLFSKCDGEFLEQLQDAHDSCRALETALEREVRFEDLACQIAERFDLAYTPVDK